MTHLQTHLHQNVDDMLADLSERSQTETDFVRRLSDAIRRVDEQLLRDVRSVSLQHEVRREAILGELQGLAVRLCALPARAAHSSPRAEIDHRPHSGHNGRAISSTTESETAGGADWRRAAQAIDDELEFRFSAPTPPQPPRH